MYYFLYNLRKILAFLALLALLPAAALCQEEGLRDLDLQDVPYAWLSVLSGSAVAAPVKAAYGWFVPCEGKMACAFTESGSVLWQKPLPGQALPLAACDEDGFSLAVLKGRRVCLLNPSGLVLWQKPLDFEPCFPPLFLRDGRIFVFGKQAAAAFGMNGIQKWKADLEALSSKLAPVQMNDGSVAVFLEAEHEGKTCALRVSPFGETLERIVFAGRVSAAAQVQDGALLCFDDGSAGLCSAGGQGAASKWALNGLGLGSKTILLALDGGQKAAAVSKNAAGARAVVFDAKKGLALNAFDADFKDDVQAVWPCPDGLFLAGENSGVLYSFGGKKIRGVKFPPKTKKFNWNHALFAKNGSLIFTSKNWSLVGFRVIKASPAPKRAAAKRQGLKNFYMGQSDDFYRIKAAALSSRKAALQAGNYGAAEKDYLFGSQKILEGFFDKALSQNSVGGAVIGSLGGEGLFDFSLSEENAAIGMLGLYGSWEAAAALARVLRVSKDESVLSSALKAVQDCGYDPDGALMDAIEALAKGALPSQENFLTEICASLYSVCRFMGRPALIQKGLKILASLQFPQYPNSTKEEARKIYEKLAKLQL